MIVLNGITWDHSRGYDPLIAASEIYRLKFRDISIKWEKRTLAEFGDFPVSTLAERFDLVMVDHPFSGEAIKNDLFVDLNDYISDAEATKRKEQSVGPSVESYLYKGKLMAFACDAAAQVSAFLSTKMKKEFLPETWEELKYFSRHNHMSTPLCAVDMWCVFLTISAQLSGGDFISDKGFDLIIGEQTIEILYTILDISHPDSINLNPIHVLDRMQRNEDIIYSPFIFGYTNYSRLSDNGKIFFSDVFSFSDKPISLLGGVGVAVSSQSNYIQEAVDFAKFISDVRFQENEYFLNNGQPACLGAWKSRKNNTLCNNFFRNTISTLENAYVRPRIPKFNGFQERVSYFIHSAVQKKVSARSIIGEINDEYNKILKEN